MDENPAADDAGFREALRMLHELERKQYQMGTEQAKELGFSSYEEYLEDLGERHRRDYEDYERRMDENCARLGKTREELEMEDPQRYVPDCWDPDCDCDGKYAVLENRQV